MKNLIIIPLLISVSLCDVYLHNPRGNNNRCDRRTNDRRNANRLFDSQNNAAGGYAAPCNRLENNNITCYQMNYYEESYLPIRWTSQHSCGENNDCQYILQYSCENVLGENIRDGHPQNTHGDSCTDTIPEREDNEIENMFKYGKHENYNYYQKCKNTTRNKGLFTANQRLRGESSIYTRQNPNGNRYGFECPEERDYYPYWRHSPWFDIGVLVENSNRCDYYTNNTQCHVSRYECYNSNGNVKNSINYDECISNGGEWIEHISWNENSSVPDCNFTCGLAPSSIINRLGISNNSNRHQEYMWKLPKVDNTMRNCVIRLRYNISTADTPWNLTYENNSIIHNNPVVNISNVPLRLAVDTSQFGRVFEDRTWTFNILKRPETLKEEHIYNFNVQGKRGNIAQVRNCIEYDFVPNRLNISTNDYIHFQWVGSDYNPPNNAGEGRDGTDRSNIVESSIFKNAIPENELRMFDTEILSKIFASLDQPIDNPEKCFTYDELVFGHKKNLQNDIKNCALLNRADPYFNYMPIKINKTGKYYIISTRNNNFSNRGQKAIIDIYTIEENIPNTTNNFEVEASTDDSMNRTSIIPIMMTFVVVVLIMSMIAIYYRNDERRENIKRVYRNMKRTFSRQV